MSDATTPGGAPSAPRDWAGIRSAWLTWALGLALILLFVGERAIGVGRARGIVSGLGVLLLVGVLGLRLGRWVRSAGERRRAEGLLTLLVLGVVLALGLYALQSDLMDGVLGKPVGQAWPKLSVVLAVLFPAVLVLAALPLALVELAHGSMARAPVLEPARLREALWSGVGMASVLVLAFSAVYVATERDTKVDLSYFRTARPGESSRKIVEQLDEPLEVSLFFPPGNEVKEEVAEYFSDLAQHSERVHVTLYDHDVDRAKAKELGVTGNGAVVLQKGTRHEQLVVGQRLDSARTQLKALDQEVQKRLLTVTRPRKVVYFVVGHGERTETKEGAADQRSTVGMFKDLLRAQNEELRTLSAAEGLASDVPRDAAALVILGPTQPFLPEELAALQRYLDRAGRLLVALEPGSATDLRKLLGPLGVQVVAGQLANDQVFARLSYSANDHLNLVSSTFPAHPAVATLNQLAGRSFVALLGASAVEPAADHAKGLRADVILRAQKETWSDLDGDLLFEPQSEQRKAWGLAVAVATLASAPEAAVPAAPGETKPDAKPEERAIVTGDVDMFTDAALGPSRGNAFFAADAMRWLLGEDSISGSVNSEADVALEHTRGQDSAWFYGTMFGMPALVLGCGLAMTRRRGRKARAEGKR